VSEYVAAVKDGWGDTWASGSGELTDVKNLYADAFESHDLLAGVFDTGGFALDVLGDLGDPLGAVIGCAVGWIVEHVGFLREPVDWLAGDPRSIEAAITTWTNVGTGMRHAAQTYSAAATGLGEQAWSGDAADAYRRKAAEWVDALQHSATLADVEGVLIGATGGLCAAFRGLIFQAVSAAIERWVLVGLVALANSAWTFGASLAGWVVDVEIEAGLLYARIMAKVAELVQKAGRIAETLGRDGGRLEHIGQRLEQLAEHMLHNVRSGRSRLGWDRRYSRADADDLAAVRRQAEHLTGSLGRLDDAFHRSAVATGLGQLKNLAELAADPSGEQAADAAAGITKTGARSGFDAVTKAPGDED
jgi:hypothetical protein